MNIPYFTYRAVHASGRIQRGRSVAPGESSLEENLNLSGFKLIEAKSRKSFERFNRPVFLPSSQDIQKLMAFCGQMEDLLRSGMPFLPALNYIAAASTAGTLRDALSGVARAVSQGTPIKTAFGLYPRVFNPVFIALLESGEASGDLISAFARLAMQLRRQANLKEQLNRALRYPLFLLFVAISVTGFMLTIVVPQIVEFLRAISGELPFLTRILIAASRFFTACWWTLLVGAVSCLSALFIARRYSEKAALLTDKWLLALPGAGNVLRKLAIARFSHSLAILLRSGISLSDSLRISSTVLGNRHVMNEASAAEKKLHSGCLFSSATSRLFSPFVTQLFRVGEESGNLAKTLEETTRHYDNEVQASIEKFIGALEPALTIVVGLLLAWVVFAVLGPVYGSLENLNQAGQ